MSAKLASCMRHFVFKITIFLYTRAPCFEQPTHMISNKNKMIYLCLWRTILYTLVATNTDPRSIRSRSKGHTICLSNLDPFYLSTYYKKWDKTIWTEVHQV